MEDLDMSQRYDDETLVCHCLSGDKKAFTFLVHKYKDLVHAYACQRVGNYADAEDITQNVFIRAYRNLAKLRYPHNFRSWLYTIASNECNRYLSRKLKYERREVNLEDVDEEDLKFEADFSRTPTDWQVDLEEAILNLPEDSRIAVSMFYMSNCSIREISEYLGVSINTVKSKLRRARQKLGDMLESYGNALSKNRLKGGFIMQVMEQLHRMPLPTIPPAWRGILTRQAPLTIATTLCVLLGILGILLGDAQQTRLVPRELTEVVWLMPPVNSSGMPLLAQITFPEDDTKETDQVLAEADALLAEKEYGQAAEKYRSVIESASSERLKHEAYYGLATALYKWDWTAGDRTDEAIGALTQIPQHSQQWPTAQVLLGRSFVRKAIWTKGSVEKQKHYQTVLSKLQTLLSGEATDELDHSAEYLRILCQVELGELNPHTPYASEQLQMALEDEDSEVRFAAAEALNASQPGMHIMGTVTARTTGEPIQGAKVWISRTGEDETDLEGGFSIDNLTGREGNSILWLDAKGYGMKRTQFIISDTEPDTRVDVQLGPGATVAGRIVDPEGNPVTDAKVTINADSHPLRSYKTDYSGSYQLENIEVKQEPYRLYIEHSDFMDTSHYISVDKTDAVKVPDITLERGSSIKGLVMDEGGNPVIGAIVKMKTVAGTSVRKRSGVDETDENGEYHLKNLRGDSTTIVVDSPNFMPAYRKVELDPASQLPPVDFILESGKTLIGSVVDEQGKPIEGVKLRLQTWEAVEIMWFRHSAVTDSDGEFRMEHLPDGRITLNLMKEDYKYINDYQALVEAAQSVTKMKTPIVIQKPAYIYGKVVDATTGQPIRNFVVKAQYPKKLQPGDIRPGGFLESELDGFATQSETGEFKTLFNGFRGMVIALQVEAEGYAPAYIPRAVFGAYDEEPLVIRMDKEKQISGIVVDAETDRPLSGALVNTFDRDHELMIRSAGPMEMGASLEVILSDEEGGFILPIVMAEEFYIYVTHPDRSAAIVGPLYTSDSKTIRVEMQKGCALQGTVEPGRRMSLEPANRVPHLMFSLFADPSQEGIYRFENVTPGEYQLTEVVWGDGFGAVGRTLYVQLQAGETRNADFLIKDRTRRVYGQITDADETPIKEATVRALPANVKIADIKLLSLEMQGAALTDADGHYEILGLSPGDYVIEVRERRTPIEIDRIAMTPEQIEKVLRENQPRTAKSTFTMNEDDKEVEVNFVLSEN